MLDTEDKINSFIELMLPFGIKDIVRSGTVAIGLTKDSKA